MLHPEKSKWCLWHYLNEDLWKCAPGKITSLSPEDLMKMLILWPHPRLTDWKSPHQPVFNKLPRPFWCMGGSCEVTTGLNPLKSDLGIETLNPDYLDTAPRFWYFLVTCNLAQVTLNITCLFPQLFLGLHKTIT